MTDFALRPQDVQLCPGIPNSALCPTRPNLILRLSMPNFDACLSMSRTVLTVPNSALFPSTPRAEFGKPLSCGQEPRV